MKANRQAGFRVDLKLADSSGGGFIEYTSLRVPVDRDMAEALGRGLKRQNAAGRIVEVPSGNVIEEWEAE